MDSKQDNEKYDSDSITPKVLDTIPSALETKDDPDDIKNEEETEQEVDSDQIQPEMAELLEMMEFLLKNPQTNVYEKDVESTKEFTYEELLEGLAANTSVESTEDVDAKKGFKKIVFLTGAGISVSAGIPDFRTPGSGLYSQLEKFKLPAPEAIFEINYFKHSPEAFYKLSKEFMTCGSHPTVCHFFIAELHRRNKLLINYSQNIDGLEIEAGVPVDKLVQAHGHFRTAKCTACREVADITEFQKCVTEDRINYCDKCKKGLVKPDIVFFGETLPKEFFQKMNVLSDADLVFVIGTSLKVFPFASLVDQIK